VFIRRPERRQHIIRDGSIQHGHRAEWIILDFADNARRVDISSDKVTIPVYANHRSLALVAFQS